MSDFLPAETATKLPSFTSPVLSKFDIKSHKSASGHFQPLKTSDDSKWRIGLLALPPQLGTKFDDVKLFCAKDALENAADGEFRWIFMM